METLLQRADRQSRLPARTLTYWQIEKRLIHALASLPLDHSALDIFPCTPVFAEKFGLSEALSTCLSAQRAAMSEQGEAAFEVIGSLYKKRPHLLLIVFCVLAELLHLLLHNKAGCVSGCRRL